MFSAIWRPTTESGGCGNEEREQLKNPEEREKPETEVPVTREDLYAAVWRTPMRTLARRYGCSDSGLARPVSHTGCAFLPRAAGRS